MSKRKHHNANWPKKEPGSSPGNSESDETSSVIEAEMTASTGVEPILEKLSQLERLVRGAGRDSLTVVQSQQEMQAAFKGLNNRLDDIALDIKGVIQTTWKMSQENRQNTKDVEEHFAGALRDLEKRIREELSVQVQRSSMRALLPALDDMDLVLAQEKKLNPNAEDSFHKGMQLVRQKFRQGLREMGFDEIPVDPGVTPYDSAEHDVVELDIPPSLLEEEEAPSGSILFLRRPGYSHNGHTFRAPQVFIKP